MPKIEELEALATVVQVVVAARFGWKRCTKLKGQAQTQLVNELSGKAQAEIDATGINGGASHVSSLLVDDLALSAVPSLKPTIYDLTSTSPVGRSFDSKTLVDAPLIDPSFSDPAYAAAATDPHVLESELVDAMGRLPSSTNGPVGEIFSTVPSLPTHFASVPYGPLSQVSTYIPLAKLHLPPEVEMIGNLTYSSLR